MTYRYVEGVIHGEASVTEPVAALSELAAGRATIPYEIAFHIVAPESASGAEAVVVEAPNRGNNILARTIGDPAATTADQAGGASPAAAAIGDGYLLKHRISLAAVQWQAGLAGGPPESAQGMGEVAVRDFGRWLGGAFRSGPAPVPIFRHRILAGASQSAWFVNTFLSEGFNADPETGRGVYQGAFTRNGNGVVLAINGFAEGDRQFPYARNDIAPLAPDELLSRPASDPKLIDVISLSDFYRLRASLFARAPERPGLHRYATAAPHARGDARSPDAVFETMKCNGGAPIALSTVSDALYLRPLVLGLFRSIGEESAAKRDLPPDARFILAPAPTDLEGLNRIGATPLWIPERGENGAQWAAFQCSRRRCRSGLPSLRRCRLLSSPRSPIPAAISPDGGLSRPASSHAVTATAHATSSLRARRRPTWSEPAICSARTRRPRSARSRRNFRRTSDRATRKPQDLESSAGRN